MLAVRSPAQGADVGVVFLGELLGGAGLYIIEVKLGFSGGISNPGYPFAVRAPLGVTVVGVRAAGEVTGNALAHRHVEYFSAGADNHAGAIGGCAGVVNVTAVQFAALGAAVDGVGGQFYANLAVISGGGVQLVQPAAVFKHDGLAVGGRELYVIFLEVGNLAGGAGAGVIGEQVHHHISVAGEENLVSYPHGEDILGGVVGNVGHLLGLGIVNPDVIGHAAAVVFPGAEFTHHAVVGHLFAVRAPGKPAAFRQG